jgi:hypothetical protein
MRASALSNWAWGGLALRYDYFEIKLNKMVDACACLRSFINQALKEVGLIFILR